MHPKKLKVNWEKINALFEVLISDMGGKSDKPDFKEGKTSVAKPGLLDLGECLNHSFAKEDFVVKFCSEFLSKCY